MNLHTSVSKFSIWFKFWTRRLVKILKLNFAQEFELEFGPRSWDQNLVMILKLKFEKKNSSYAIFIERVEEFWEVNASRSVVPLTISFFYPNPYHIRRKSVGSILLDASSVWSRTETKFESEITERVSHHGLHTSQPQGVEPALQISFIVCLDSYDHFKLKHSWFFVSSVRSSNSHPDLLLTHQQHPLFQTTPVLNTGLSLSEPLWLYKGYDAI